MPVQAEPTHAMVQPLRRLQIEGPELVVVLLQSIVLLLCGWEGVHALYHLAHMRALDCKLLHVGIGPELAGS